MSMCRLLLCCWKRVFATSAFSWQNSISLCPASFCTPRPNLPVTPGVSWLPTFACHSPIMKAERQRTDAFELWYWRRPLRVPWTARRSNQSILKEISSEYPLEGLMLKLKLQHFGHLMWRANPLENTLMPWRRRRRGQQRMRWHHWLNGHEFEQAWGDGEGQGRLACYSPWGHKELDTTEGLNTTTFQEIFSLSSPTYT